MLPWLIASGALLVAIILGVIVGQLMRELIVRYFPESIDDDDLDEEYDKLNIYRRIP